MPQARTARTLYCVIPHDLAGELHDELREFFRDDPGVEVVVDRRRADRRKVRHGNGNGNGNGNGHDRRSALDPRSATRHVEAPQLPRRACRHVARLKFLERIEPATEVAEDQDSDRLITRFQAGESEAFAQLYLRYYDRIYCYLRVALRKDQDAEDATQQVFADALRAMPRYEVRPGQPFRAWLFRIARNHAVRHQTRRKRVEVMDPVVLAQRRDRGVEDVGVRSGWVSDRRLLALIELLPDAQRQTIALQYLIGFNTREVAELLGRPPDGIRQLRHRALRFLELRMAPGRAATGVRLNRAPMAVMKKPTQLLRARRFSLAQELRPLPKLQPSFSLRPRW